MTETFSKDGIENVLAELKTDSITNARSGTGDICPSKCKICKSLRITIEQCQHLNTELTSQVCALTEVIKSNKQELSSVKEATKNKDLCLNKLENTISKLKRELRVLQQLLEKSTHKKQSLYARLKECKAEVERHEDTVGKMKDVIKQIQSRESNYKQRAEQYATEKRETKKQLDELKATSDYLHLENVQMTKPEISTRSKGTTFTDNIRKCIMAHQGEAGVSAKQCSPVIQIVAKHVFDVVISSDDLPTERTAINMADEGHWLSKYQVGESLQKETWDLHSDGTTRDHRKIMGHQVTLKSGNSLSLGFRQVATEDSATLLDIAIETLQELGSIVDGDAEEEVSQEILKNLCSVMSDRASVNKKFNSDLNSYRQRKLKTDDDVQFLYCNAHFLLGLSNKCETKLKDIEKELEESVGHKLGRNQLNKFQSFKGSETSTARVIRTGSDCLGPRGDEKSGCRGDWEAYCHEMGVQSRISSFRMNRFNNFFHGAGALYHHRAEIVNFLSGGYLKSVNMKLESVLHDLKSPEVGALLRALGIIYFKITGPYWSLMNSDTHYLDLHKFIQQLLKKLQMWSVDASPMLDESEECVFETFPVKRDDVFKTLFVNVTPAEAAITKNALQKLMSGFVAVTQKQLADFLEGGVYGSEPTEDQRCMMNHCVLHNLMSEYAFGDLDYSQHRRRHSSLHHHSTLHMLKHNKTVTKWLANKCADTQVVLMAKARGQGSELRKTHRASEKAALAKRKQILRANREKREEKLRKAEERKKTIVTMVKKQGGPCSTTTELTDLEQRCGNRVQFRQALIWELKFLKDVLGVKHANLCKIVGHKDVNVLKSNLADILNCETELQGRSAIHCAVSSQEPETTASPVVDKPRNGPSSKRRTSPPSTSIKPPKQSRKQKAKDQLSEQPSKLTRIDFQFSRQGTWVAVAYDRGSWYLGQVVNVESADKGSVQFLKHVRGSLYTWPSVEDVDVVEALHVFDTDIEVSTTNGRVWLVPEHGAINKKYKTVRHLYE
jgi:hypothetical protein